MIQVHTLSLFLFLMAALIWPQQGHTATLATPAVSGYASGMYSPYVNPGYTAGSLSGSGVVNVGGRAVTLPATLPPAANAANYAKSTLFANPLLVGAALMAWSGDAGLGSDQVGGWQISVPPPEGADPNFYYYINWLSGQQFDSPQQACQAAMDASVASNGNCGFSLGTASAGACYLVYSSPNECGKSPGPFAWESYGSAQRAVCPAGSTGTPPNCVLTPETRPATLDDFLALPDPPVAALAEMAPQVGVPVDAPVYAPADYPVGAPYTKPDGSTAQPMVKVSPAGDGQVWLDTYDVPLTTPTGDPVADPVPSDTADPAPESQPSPTQCEKFPGSLGCANLDTPDAELLGEEARSIANITPVAIGGAGACPAPLTTSFMGQPLEIAFTPLCTYANALRPLVLAIAWLAAGVVFIGGVRNG